MSKKLKYIIIGIATAIILGLVWALVAVASSSSNDSNPTEKISSSTTTRTLTGNVIADDRAAVYKAATELLEATNAPADQETYIALLGELDSATVADIPKEFLDKARFADLLDKDELKITSYQALITFAALAKASSEDGTIASLYADGPMSIFVDQETGIAQVPMNIFVNQDGEANTFSMEFVYVDNEWKFAPYSVLDQLRLSLALQQQAAAAAK